MFKEKPFLNVFAGLITHFGSIKRRTKTNTRLNINLKSYKIVECIHIYLPLKKGKKKHLLNLRCCCRCFRCCCFPCELLFMIPIDMLKITLKKGTQTIATLSVRHMLGMCHNGNNNKKFSI